MSGIVTAPPGVSYKHGSASYAIASGIARFHAWETSLASWHAGASSVSVVGQLSSW
jgi:hypothetical protein